MISFEHFTPTDGMPIYQQILLYIERGAAAGTITDGDELPSRRYLSALLGINPNTVQKAFRLLEEAGLVESRTGAKSVMTLEPEKLEYLKSQLLAEDMKGIVRALKQTGVTKEQALQMVEFYWDSREDLSTRGNGAQGAASDVSEDQGGDAK